MNRKKRLTTLILALLMLISLFPLSAQAAAEGTDGESSDSTDNKPSDNAPLSTTATTTEGAERISVKAVLVGKDEDDQDELRPVKVEIELLADGQVVAGKTAELKAGEDGIWSEDELSFTWTELPKSGEGKAIAYSVQLKKNDGAERRQYSGPCRRLGHRSARQRGPVSFHEDLERRQ